jgi:hypothetical protein
VQHFREVESMLPLSVLDDGYSGEDNFLTEEIRAAVRARLAMRSRPDAYWPPSIALDRLFRNMLSSQPAAFNAFGHAVTDPDSLRPWLVARVEPDVVRVSGVRIEWAPPRKEHFDNGSAFDVCVFYETTVGKGFVAVECKYAEDLTEGFEAAKAERYREPIEALGMLSVPFAELNSPSTQQFLLNVALAESLRQREGYQSAHSVVMACGDDESAKEATRAMAAGLAPDAIDLVWSPYEELLDDLDPAAWIPRFRARYLEDQ